ncbi:MAG: tRNA pseudouridine(38-40) synthase TruA [Ignavibacteria bacterium]|nr:tRNA pseudouridine(38-40) synthase TruA [Ignavibacteria bacterium]
MALRNYRIEIEYDGSDFQGWQRQKKSPNTIQEVLEKALSKLLKEEIKITGAGRTDAGVHAIAQTANFRTTKITENSDRFLYSLNSIISSNITVKSISPVPEEFHSRYSAKSREYIYQITTRRKSLYGKYYFKLRYELDFKVIDDFTKILKGYKSFKSLCKNREDKHEFKCNLIELKYSANNKNGTIIFKIRSDRFLHSMVRATIGCLIDLGRNRLDFIETAAKFRKGEKIKATYLPSNALFLNKIYY